MGISALNGRAGNDATEIAAITVVLPQGKSVPAWFISRRTHPPSVGGTRGWVNDVPWQSLLHPDQEGGFAPGGLTTEWAMKLEQALDQIGMLTNASQR
jgi:hypothetical protein